MDKLYYTIGEVAELLATSTSQLRYWSGEFSLNVRKNRKGDRLFQKEDLDKLKWIQKLLKEEGFTIEGAKKKMKSMNKVELKSEIQPEIIVSTPIISNQINQDFDHLRIIEKSDIIVQLKAVRTRLKHLIIDIDSL